VNERSHLLQEVADRILKLPHQSTLRVAVDGVDGAGKTVFADELAPFLASSGRQIIRTGVDFFHNPRAVRYRLGATSPEGFFRDSYNYELLKTALLKPLEAGGTREFRRAAFDHRTDSPIAAPLEVAAPDSILLFDGIFLHRSELREFWEFSIFLEVPFSVSVPRYTARDGGPSDPLDISNRRYIEGQKLYLSQCRPRDWAKIVVNNEDLEKPYLINP
jgi:uridine kinase